MPSRHCPRVHLVSSQERDSPESELDSREFIRLLMTRCAVAVSVSLFHDANQQTLVISDPPTILQSYTTAFTTATWLNHNIKYRRCCHCCLRILRVCTRGHLFSFLGYFSFLCWFLIFHVFFFLFDNLQFHQRGRRSKIILQNFACFKFSWPKHFSLLSHGLPVLVRLSLWSLVYL